MSRARTKFTVGVAVGVAEAEGPSLARRGRVEDCGVGNSGSSGVGSSTRIFPARVTLSASARATIATLTLSLS
jgi:hypothetical protein